MTMRQHYAAKALPALVERVMRIIDEGHDNREDWKQVVAREAFEIADAMLAAEKGGAA